MLGNGLTQKLCSAFRHITVEGLLVRLIGYALVKCRNNCITKRQRYITDAHTVNMLFGMLHLIFLYLLRDTGEQIGFFKVSIVHIRCNHSIVSPS